MNNGYWKKLYKKNIVPKKESNFAKFVFNYIRKNKLKGSLLDVGCGNGRDTFYFFNKGMHVMGIDKHPPTLSTSPEIIKQNILTFEYSNYKFIYIRFVIHAISEKQLNKLLLKIRNKQTFVFIETRSTKGLSADEKSKLLFNSGIGDSHFRMLYSKEYLTKKLSKKFKVLYVKESKNFAKYKSENPYCLRYVLMSNI